MGISGWNSDGAVESLPEPACPRVAAQVKRLLHGDIIESAARETRGPTDFRRTKRPSSRTLHCGVCAARLYVTN